MTKEDILKDLLMTPSPSGCEQAIIKKMAMFLKDYIDELSIDNYGNLIALKYGNQRNKKLMLACSGRLHRRLGHPHLAFRHHRENGMNQCRFP